MAKAFARVATFEGTGPERLDEVINANRDQIEAGLASPPAGLEGVSGVWMLVDRESGVTMDLTLFDTEDDLRRGDEALNGLSPDESEGRRTSVGLYEIAFRIEGS
ncbi:MAG: hypothetical protein ACHQJ5_06030 [Vicinamibacteria bacterium]|jgi:hypothetical protein